ncbi:MAG: alpha/beta hydrolase [Spirochaetaceae bacterium]|nr:alpha/beta hydrolase [Spirochaetaceae bacterium]
MGQHNFEQYRLEAINWVEKHRDFQTEDREQETLRVAPREWRPDNISPEKGILLVHGLGNSSWDFVDIAPVLANNGFLVRTVLLAGCGTKPSDMLYVTIDDWRRTIREQIAILSKEVKDVYLGGFSGGVNLVLEYAMNQPEIKGLLLFSSAIKAKTFWAFTAPVLAKTRKWALNPKKHPAQFLYRYINMPTNALKQFYSSSVSARSLLKKNYYTKPVLIVQTRHDYIVNSRYILKLFESKFTHPDSRLIWYGDLPAGAKISSRVLARSDYLPEWKISQFSHSSVLFSPKNEEYGREGRRRFCWNGQKRGDYEKCLLGEDVWYSDYGYREKGKIHARLTFNPYFEWQAEIMLEVLKSQ